jgi:hypothetical protein
MSCQYSHFHTFRKTSVTFLKYALLFQIPQYQNELPQFGQNMAPGDRYSPHSGQIVMACPSSSSIPIIPCIISMGCVPVKVPQGSAGAASASAGASAGAASADVAAMSSSGSTSAKSTSSGPM